MSTAREELTDAIRHLNTEYRKLPNPDAVDISSAGLASLEAQIETAMTAGDQPAARHAIHAWRRRYLQVFEESRRG